MQTLEKNLVSICIPTWNGARYLRAALDSLLAQDYRKIEVIVLDNRSTDETSAICKEFALGDERFRYILDDVMVGDPEGHCKVANFAGGEFFLIACDDDVYAPTYVSRLMAVLQSQPEVGMAYTGLGYIDGSGKLIGSSLKKKYFLLSSNSKFYNFCFYLIHRSPIPLQFGLMRTDCHMKALEYFFRVDRNRGDHDNLYMLRLLGLTRVTSIDDPLFFYRIKDRSTAFSRKPRRWFETYVGEAMHQYRVALVISRIIAGSDFSKLEMASLKMFNVLVLIFNVTGRHMLQSRLMRMFRKSVPLG